MLLQFSLLTLILLQVIEDNEISEEKMKLKQNIEGTNVCSWSRVLIHVVPPHRKTECIHLISS